MEMSRQLTWGAARAELEGGRGVKGGLFKQGKMTIYSILHTRLCYQGDVQGEDKRTTTFAFNADIYLNTSMPAHVSY